MASTSELEFNKHRSLELLNLPSCSEKEVRDFLVGVSTKNVTFSESRDSAIVNLAIGRQLEDAVQKYNGKQFRDNTVVTKPGASQIMMGVGHIPLSYTDKDFRQLCEKYNPVDYAYIMRTKKSGLSKGYGVVEFKADLQQVSKIKEELDWKEVDGQSLHADFIEPSAQASYEQMQSKCLLLTGLPDTFTDVSKLRKMFGCVISPVYCQIIATDDKTPGYGIIEYSTSEEAEETWMKMKNEKIDNANVSISFCIPGKSAVVINNRITWKFADKLQKSSLLPDPVTIKPVISGNPMVISMTKMNPNLMKRFVTVLGELQQAYVSQMMSPVHKPGLLGPAPSLPLSPMMNPNMQLGLLAMLAIELQIAKKEKFTGVLAKQLNSLNDQEIGTIDGPKPSILGDPVTGQASVIFTSLKQQLNQVPVKDSDGNEVEEPTPLEEKLDFIEKKFVANGRYLNLGLLSNLGQLLVNMMQATGEFSPKPASAGQGLLSTPPVVKGQSLLGPMPGAGLMPPPNAGNKGSSLLGDAPNAPMGRNPPALMGNAFGGRGNNSNSPNSQGILGSGRSSSLSQTILGQISQGLVNQIGQNIMYQLSVNQNKPNQSGGMGKGLLGDVPQGTSSNTNMSKNKSAGKNSLLGEPPNQYKGNQQSSMSSNLDQGSWKGSDNRWGGAASSYESGYGNKSNMGMGMGGNYGDYNYGQDSYSDMGGNYGGGNYGGGYGDNDFYNNYQQQMYNMCDGTSGYYAEYSSSNFGSGSGYGSGTGSGNMGMGGGGGNYGMGGGMLGNQASGVNFQDGQSFGKGSTSNGLGQDNGRYAVDGYGGNMGGMTNYSYSSGREDMTDGSYDSYRSSVGMGGGYGSGMAGMGDNMSMGMSGSMTGMTGMSGGTGMGSGAGMGNMGLMGTGNNMGGSGNMGMSGAFGNSYSTQAASGMSGGNSNSMMGGGGMTTGGAGSMADSSYSTGMGSGRMGMSGMGGSGANNYSGGMGMMGSSGYGTGTSSNKMSGGMGGMSGANNMSNMSGFGVGDQNSTSYQTMGSSGGSGASGLLPSPGKYLSPGQKRTYSQFLPNQEAGTDSTDYIGQHSQGLTGQYMDSFKRSRLY